MTKQFIRLLSDVDCEWEGLPPTYRAYVNDELFTERTWRWTDSYLREIMQIEAEPGDYTIRYELVPPNLAKISVKNTRVDYGSGQMISDTILRII